MKLSPTHTAQQRAAWWPTLSAALLLAGTLGGCSAESDGPADEATPLQPIAFAAANPATTRTAPGTLTLDGLGTGEQSLCATGFGVFACHTGLHPYVSSDVTPNYMWNQRVDYNATTQMWDYTPLLYWPRPIDGLQPYVSFFAYAPYAAEPGTGHTDAERCIVDMSHSVERGDPWLVYQLGGSETDWQAHQVDLLYDFRRDQQQGDHQQRVNFMFRHALASAGDQVRVTTNPKLRTQLMQACDGTPVSLTLERVTLVYTLLRKGKLSLGSGDAPQWKPVVSETPTVRRRLDLQPDGGHMLCTATSTTTCTVIDYIATDQGIFYIPLTSNDITQQVEITLAYHTSLDPATTLTLDAKADLSTVAKANSNCSLHIEIPALDIP